LERSISSIKTKEKNVKSKLLALIVVGLISAGCAATDEKQVNSAPQEDKEYVTGSAIPKRDRSAKATGVKTADPAAILDSLNRGAPSANRGAGTGP
jgi:hypothetical protein